ncbi:MAG: thioredoxin family protein [Lutibacter sp.]|uniref:thioredoxin family protein n=1 Tax=Lutibacter sp. TaxID=1925666 RepID=UPI0017E8DE27|nr:thioredoxin family protein [Lutibacter sp.]MBT8316034.1 thioredoxin family protein [Lutibacter sp.]NNJ56894.1 thioredoxin family protein [Lutibacter sp.]
MKTLKSILLVSVFIIATAFTIRPVADGYKIGDTATDFKLKNVDGKMVSMSDYENAKGFIVIFTCNHCPFSIAYEDRIIDLDKQYKDKGYPVIAINPNNPEISKGDDFVSMQKRAKEKGFTFPYLFDDGQKIFPQYGATRTPHVFLLNKEDKELKVAYIGAIDNNYSDATAVTEKYVEDAINALIEGEKPNPNFTKAIGCTIKK